MYTLTFDSPPVLYSVRRIMPFIFLSHTMYIHTQAIHMSSLYENRLSNLKYLLTSVPPPNIDAQDSDGYTAIRAAVCNNNHRALKLLIDFDADR